MQDLTHLCEVVTTGVASAITLKPLLEKLLGPACEYAGKSIADLMSRYGNKNIADILVAMSQLVQGRGRDGFVNPRLLGVAIHDGSLCEDELTKLYFAGLLASSTSPDGRDDRGLRYMNIVRELTRTEIAIHHTAYTYLRQAFRNSYFDVESVEDRTLLELCVDKATFTATIQPAADTEIIDAVASLQSAGLFEYAEVDGLAMPASHQRKIETINSFGVKFEQCAAMMMAAVRFQPTILGTRLFLWIYGYPDTLARNFFEEDIAFSFDDDAESDKLFRYGIARARIEIADEMKSAANRVALTPSEGPWTDEFRSLYQRWKSAIHMLRFPDLVDELAHFKFSSTDCRSFAAELREIAEVLERGNAFSHIRQVLASSTT